MKHKRKKPKNARRGCLLCKPWKMNGFKTSRKGGERFSDHRRRSHAEQDIREYVG
jgi:hypothetical protein